MSGQSFEMRVEKAAISRGGMVWAAQAEVRSDTGVTRGRCQSQSAVAGMALPLSSLQQLLHLCLYCGKQKPLVSCVLPYSVCDSFGEWRSPSSRSLKFSNTITAF